MAEPVTLHEHPDFKERRDDFETYQDLVDGKQARLVSSKYLWPHRFEEAGTTEAATLRTIRERLSQYTNLTEPVESTWISIVFKQDHEPSPELNTLLGDFARDVDGEQHDLMGFLREKVGKHYFRFGIPIIRVNAPMEAAANRLDEQQRGIRPFLETISPLQLKDWELRTDSPAHYGKFKMLRWEYLKNKERTSLREKPEQILVSKCLELIDGKVIETTYEQKDESGNKRWEEVDSAVLPGWDEIPVVALFSESWLKDVAKEQLRLFNQISWRDTQFLAQAYQRIFISGMRDDKAKIAMGEFMIGFTPENSQVTVVEPTNPQALMGAIEETKATLFKVAFNRAHTLNDTSKEAPSADASAEMKSEQMALALQAIGDLENLINQALKFYAKFKNAEWSGELKLSRKVSDADIQRSMALYQAHMNIITKIPAWLKAYALQVAKEMNLPNTDEIEKAIEGGALEKAQEQAQQQQAAIGGARARLLARVNSGGTEGDPSADSGKPEEA